MAKPKSLVQGYGINDADYPVYDKNKDPVRCTYYNRWRNMLIRCYSDVYKEEKPTYMDATLRQDWIYFMSFKRWMENQIWEGLHLDKDILVMGNKEYGPDTCCFVPQYINSLLNTNDGYREQGLPIGVAYYKPLERNKTWKYVSRVCEDGKQKHLGYTLSYKEGHHWWQIAKADQIERMILKYMLEPCYRQDVANALYERVEMLRNDAEAGRETKFL